MKNYQPLLLSKLKIQLPGLHIRQLELHRHLVETASVHPHSHTFAQYLCYLSGEGRQEIDGQSWSIRAGTAVYLPSKSIHAFRREGPRRPICLVINFNWQGGAPSPRVEVMPTALLRELRQHLSRLAHVTALPAAGPPHTLALTISTEILALLDLLLHRKAHTHHPAPQSLTQKVSHLLETHPPKLALREVARQTGYQYDYLNRRLRAESGLTIGQLKNRRLLHRAQQALRTPCHVAAVAEECGFQDPNYFSRWFLKQSGLSPTQWRKQKTI